MVVLGKGLHQVLWAAAVQAPPLPAPFGSVWGLTLFLLDLATGIPFLRCPHC